MSESEWSLLGFLAAIYLLSGCLWWIRREAVGFRAAFLGPQRFVPGNGLLGNGALVNGALGDGAASKQANGT